MLADLKLTAKVHLLWDHEIEETGSDKWRTRGRTEDE